MRIARSTPAALAGSLAAALAAVLAASPARAQPEGPLTPAAALSLATAYEARFQAAQAGYRAEIEALPLARAGLLPEINVNAARNFNQLDARAGARLQPQLDYFSSSASITLRQPIYRRENWARYRQADAEVRRQDAVLASERARLAQELAGAYLEVLRTHADLQARRAEQLALSSAAAAAARGVPLGLASASDRDSRQARADLALLKSMEAAARRSEAVRLLERMVGRRVRELMAPPADARFDGAAAVGESLAQWQERARARSPEVQAAQAAVEVAREGINRAKAGAHPTLDLVAGRSRSVSDSFTAINNTYFNTSVGLQASVPLYAGGRNDAAVRQAVAQLERAQALLDGALREQDDLVERDYQLLAEAAERLRAHDAVVQSAEQAVQAARQGISRGLQSNVELLDAQGQLAAASAERLTARLQLLAAQLRLQVLAGDAQWLSLEPLQRWLTDAVAVRP